MSAKPALAEGIPTIKIGTQVTTPDGNAGTVQRNGHKTGAHMVRVNDKWFLASECSKG